MRDKIAEIIIDNALTDSDEFVTRADALACADAILALEVDGKTKCSLAPCCPDGRQPDPDKCRECKLNKPATIADLIEVK